MTRILLRGGYVHTPADPHASALCLEDGAIVWTGDDDASVHFEDNADRVVDLEGRLVTPAFVDSHAHLAQTGFATASVDLGAAATLHEALDAVAAAAHSSAETVLLGFNWDETGWPEQRPFTRDELDRATGGRAVFLSRVDVHSAVVSSAFLDACPEVVHADGYDATGLVARDAHHAAREGLFRLQSASAREDAILRALEDAARHGIGMVHELGAPHICPAEDLLVSAALTKRAPLPEVVGYWGELGGVEPGGASSAAPARRATSAWTAPSAPARRRCTRRTPTRRRPGTSTSTPARCATTSSPARAPASRRAST